MSLDNGLKKLAIMTTLITTLALISSMASHFMHPVAVCAVFHVVCVYYDELAAPMQCKTTGTHATLVADRTDLAQEPQGPQKPADYQEFPACAGIH